MFSRDEIDNFLADNFTLAPNDCWIIDGQFYTKEEADIIAASELQKHEEISNG